jgi:phage gpG-like protein
MTLRAGGDWFFFWPKDLNDLADAIDPKKGASRAQSLEKRVAGKFKKAFSQMGADWERALKARHGTGGAAASPITSSRPGRLYRRDGALMRSVKFFTEPSAGGKAGREGYGGAELTLNRLALVMMVGDSATPYAKIHEYGGTVTPKSKKWLTVPLPDAVTPSGRPKGAAQIRRTGDGWETDMGPTFILQKGSRRFIAVQTGKDIKLLYTLRKSVTIPPRLNMVRTFEERAGFQRNLLKTAMRDALDSVGKGKK